MFSWVNNMLKYGNFSGILVLFSIIIGSIAELVNHKMGLRFKFGFALSLSILPLICLIVLSAIKNQVIFTGHNNIVFRWVSYKVNPISFLLHLSFYIIVLFAILLYVVSCIR